MKHSKGQGMQFGWLFAVIIGAVILFLAISFSGKIIGTGTYQTQAELARNFDIILNPFSSIGGAQVSLSKPVSLPEKTEVNFTCSSSLDSETMFLKLKKGDQAFPYSIKNKYVFSESFNEKELWIFAKPFEMPWRVDDLIYIVSKNYCFVNPPENIRKELSDLNSSKIIVTSTKTECKDYMTVCWIGICDILVNPDSVRTKDGKLLRYIDDSTMYAAIFGPTNYNCNLDRILNRLGNQVDIFTAKADLLSERGCIEIIDLKQELSGLKQAINSRDYGSIKDYSSKIDNKNKISCPLY